MVKRNSKSLTNNKHKLTKSDPKIENNKEDETGSNKIINKIREKTRKE